MKNGFPSFNFFKESFSLKFGTLHDLYFIHVFYSYMTFGYHLISLMIYISLRTKKWQLLDPLPHSISNTMFGPTFSSSKLHQLLDRPPSLIYKCVGQDPITKNVTPSSTYNYFCGCRKLRLKLQNFMVATTWWHQMKRAFLLSTTMWQTLSMTSQPPI